MGGPSDGDSGPALTPGANALEESPPKGKSRLSLLIDRDLHEELRNISWWEPGVDVTDIVRAGIRKIRDEYHDKERWLTAPGAGEPIHKAKGDPYPQREGELKPGRSV